MIFRSCWFLSQDRGIGNLKSMALIDIGRNLLCAEHDNLCYFIGRRARLILHVPPKRHSPRDRLRLFDLKNSVDDRLNILAVRYGRFGRRTVRAVRREGQQRAGVRAGGGARGMAGGDEARDASVPHDGAAAALVGEMGRVFGGARRGGGCAGATFGRRQCRRRREVSRRDLSYWGFAALTARRGKAQTVLCMA